MEFDQFLTELDSLSLLEALEIAHDEDWLSGYVPCKYSESYSEEFDDKWALKVSNLSPEECLAVLNWEYFDADYCDKYICDILVLYLQNNLCEENCHFLEKFSSDDYMILSWKGPKPEHYLHDFLSLDFTQDLLKADNHTDNQLTFLKSIIFEAYEYDAGLDARNTDSSIIFKIAEIVLKNKHREGLEKLSSVCIWGDEGYYSVFSSEKPLAGLLKKINGELGTTYTVLSYQEREEELDGIMDYEFEYD